MKTSSLILFCLLSLNLFAQDEPMVLEATTDKNVFLYFPSPIEKAITGNSNFQFGYNTQTAEKFGVLKAMNNSGESTLHIITADQTVYSFLVKYAAQLKQYDYFFDGSESVGNINKQHASNAAPLVEEATANPFPASPNAKKITEEDYYDAKSNDNQGDLDFCKSLLNAKNEYKNIFRTKSNILLKLSNVAYRNDKSFLVVTIENKSTVDYDLNFIQFNKIAKKASKKSNYQAIEIKPLLDSSFNTFERIPALSSHTAVYVFDKLSIDRNKLINIEINELQGERNLQLPVDHNIINNPNSNI
ncbi:DUF4138 domain-containing protein [Flagellimonas sp.]|uniref:DUF4138 domain-containing protein n=1 Tax=Flagellimonas sp. TaxID=2058762 RepID=UPI003BADAB29